VLANRYMLFAGKHYYPKGGMDDFRRGCRATMAECVAAAREGGYDWFNVYDILTEESFDSYKLEQSGVDLVAWAADIDSREI